MLRELTASQLVAIATGSDTGSHNRLDLIQNLEPTHYVCNWYISNNAIRQTFIQRKLLKTILAKVIRQHEVQDVNQKHNKHDLEQNVLRLVRLQMVCLHASSTVSINPYTQK